MWPPSNSPYCFSPTILTSPVRSPYTVPAPTAPYWTLPTTTSYPCSRACASVSPKLPTFGVQNVARGMSMYSIGWVSSPAASSTAITPSSEALWASAGPVDEVADRVHALDARAHRAVDLDQAVVGELDAGGVEAERLDVRAAAGGDHEPLDLARLARRG